MKLKLKEIIWEVTGKCNNGCTYCGSKDVWKTDIDEVKVKKIADRIAEYPPEEIDISGGDPLLVSLHLHKHIVDKLKPTTKCKILVNPKSFQNAETIEKNMEKLRLYDWVGVSINTVEELDLFKQLNFNDINYTVITNFNLTNFFCVDDFAKFVLEKDVLWQVQFTMYHSKDKEHQLALYNYPAAIDKLSAELSKYPKLKILFADNANHGECMAGIHSVGILATGDVVPCLSMRSWCDVNRQSEGNLLNAKLKEIWYSGFGENRFENFKCCKDVCNKCLLKYVHVTPITITSDGPVKVYGPYGVVDVSKFGLGKYKVDGVTAYAVQTLPVTAVYACSTGEFSGFQQMSDACQKQYITNCLADNKPT